MLVRGDKLSNEVRRQVLGQFGYRWTIENLDRARRWYNYGKFQTPKIEPITDEQWLQEHAFHITKNGKRLMKNRSRCEPACMAED